MTIEQYYELRYNRNEVRDEFMSTGNRGAIVFIKSVDKVLEEYERNNDVNEIEYQQYATITYRENKSS